MCGNLFTPHSRTNSRRNSKTSDSDTSKSGESFVSYSNFSAPRLLSSDHRRGRMRGEKGVTGSFIFPFPNETDSPFFCPCMTSDRQKEKYWLGKSGQERTSSRGGAFASNHCSCPTSRILFGINVTYQNTLICFEGSVQDLDHKCINSCAFVKSPPTMKSSHQHHHHHNRVVV